MAINYPVIFKTDTSGLKKAEGSLKNFGKVAAGVSTAAVAAIGSIAVASVKEFAKFDSALNQSIAIMGDVSDTLQTDMANAAKEVAKTTTFSAEQAAEAYFFLASAGLDAAASVEAMPQVAAFAQAGMFDMATATDLATDAQSALGLASDDATENLENLTRVTDVFVKANTLANTSVEQLATAFTTKAGNALKTVGKDVEEGAAALAVFADQGIKGERAGTLLTNTIFGLTDIMAKAPAEAERLGIEVFNAAGEMNSFADISEDLTTALSDMTKEQQIATLDSLGFTKQAREGTLALMGQADTLREYEGELRNAGGTVDEVANKQLQTLEGQFALLQSAVNVAAIEIGEVFEPFLIDLMGTMTPLVEKLTPLFVSGFENLANAFETVQEKGKGAFERLDAVASIFQRLAENEQAGDAVDFLARQFGMLGDNIVENLGEAFTKFMAFRQQLTESILEALPGIIDGIVTFLPQLITFLAEEVLPMIFEQLTGIAEQLIEILSEALPKIVEAIGEILPDLVAAITDLIPKIIETLLELIPQLLEGALEFFSSLITAFQEVLPQIITSISEMLPKIIETLVEMLPSLIESGLEFFNGIVTALVETIPILIDAFLEATPDILQAILDALPQIIEASLELFFGLVTALVDTIPEILTAIIEMIPEITTQLIDMLPDIIEAGMDLFFGIIDGLIEATPDILEAVIEMIPKITGALIGEMPKLLEAGFEILNGIATGILENLPRVAANLASSIGSAITSQVKSWFGIESPSKVFMGIGEELINGLEKGIEDTKGVAVKASLAMASDVQIAAENAIIPNRPPSINQFDAGTSGVSASGSNINITVNAGVGTDPVAVGREVVNAIRRYESTNGKVFASA